MVHQCAQGSPGLPNLDVGLKGSLIFSKRITIPSFFANKQQWPSRSKESWDNNAVSYVRSGRDWSTRKVCIDIGGRANDANMKTSHLSSLFFHRTLSPPLLLLLLAPHSFVQQQRQDDLLQRYATIFATA
jgi:hypothetical protein